MVGKNNIITYAGAADYFVFISLVPLFMIMVALMRFLPLEKSEILYYINSSLPDAIESVVSRLMNSVYYGATAAITVSIFLTIFTASAAMRSLMRALNSVYGDEREKHVVIFWLRSCIYMLIFMVLVILCFALLVYGQRLWTVLHTLLPESYIVEALFGAEQYLHYIPILSILTLGFIAMYCVLPSGRHRAENQWVGAIFSACSWLVFSWIFSLYISLSGKFNKVVNQISAFRFLRYGFGAHKPLIYFTSLK